MIKNKTAQMIYQTVYCTIGLIGVIASFGIFDDISNIRWDFYVHFTNISNYFCIGVMVTALIETIKKKDDDYFGGCCIGADCDHSLLVCSFHQSGCQHLCFL